jgi:hypothetical protein
MRVSQLQEQPYLVIYRLEWMKRPFPQYVTLLSWKSKGAKLVGWNYLFCVVLEYQADPNFSNSCVINNPRRTDVVWGWMGAYGRLQDECVNGTISHVRPSINTER